jgi:Domain of unknown function (DUF4157)
MNARMLSQSRKLATSPPSVRSNRLQRKCACGGALGPTGECEECRNKRLRRKIGNPPSEMRNDSSVPPIVHEVIRSGGEPLDPNTREFMQSRFGHDFSHVRVHTDVRATESARAVNALAYTVGRNIVFDTAQYTPGTAAGQRLLAHELTHIVQQNGKSEPTAGDLRVASAVDAAEREAERVADVVASTAAFPPLVMCPLATSVAGRQRLQRSAKFVEGTVTESFNLSERVLNGQSAGNTDFVLNGTVIKPGVSLRDALNTPDIGTSKQGNKTRCWFKSVPDNEVSYEMTVLAPGPWTAITTKAALGRLFPANPACAQGGNTRATLTLTGTKTSPEQQQRTRTHEDHHAADYKAILNDVLVPWDKRIARAHKAKTAKIGTDDADCETKIYASLGTKQPSDDIAAEIVNQINQKATAFHGSPAGRNVNISNVQFDPACTAVTGDAS